MNPLVSIIIPAYNSEKYIESSINSILNQTYEKIEIIIINDGSIDRTDEIVNKFAIQDNRIVYVKQENSGVSAARNKGIYISKGDYVTFVDSDDTIDNKYIELLVCNIINNGFDIVACGYMDISKYGIINLNDFYINDKNLSKDEFINNIFKGIGGTVWGKIFKKNIIIENNIKMKENIFMCEDMIFLLEYSMKCNKYGAISENLYNYNRLNKNSISSKINMEYYSNLIFVINEIKQILKENKYKDNYIDKILCNRVQHISTSFFVMQHDKKYNYSTKEKMDNIQTILDDKYIELYKNKFVGNTLNDKVLIFLINKHKIKILNYYSMLLYRLQIIKDKIKGLY